MRCNLLLLFIFIAASISYGSIETQDVIKNFNFCNAKIIFDDIIYWNNSLSKKNLKSIKAIKAISKKEKGCKHVLLSNIHARLNNNKQSIHHLKKAKQYLPLISKNIDLKIKQFNSKKLSISKSIVWPKKLTCKNKFSKKTYSNYNYFITSALKNGLNDLALTYAKQIFKCNYNLNHAGVKKAILLDSAVKALVLGEDIDRALFIAKKLTKATNPPTIWLQRYSWVLGKAQKYNAAALAWQDVENKATNAKVKIKSCFMAGFLLYEQNNYQLSNKKFLSCLTINKYHEPSLWYLAFTYYLLQDYESAHRYFRQLSRTFKQNATNIDKYQFWQAKALIKLKQKAKALNIFKQITTNYPWSYYALLSQKTIKKNNFDKLFTQNKKKPLSNKSINKALLLFNLGFVNQSRQIINNTFTGANRLRVLEIIGDYHYSWQLSNFFIKKNNLNDINLWHFHYPKPFLSIASANKSKIDPLLLYALMHKESGFLPSAKSNKGAIGLMQIMPKHLKKSTALNLFYDQKKYSINLVATPKIIIDTAAFHFNNISKSVSKKFLAIAAYNAGLNNVQKWQDDFGHMDEVLFIERIPFKETREYTKSVLANYAIYKLISGLKLEEIIL